MATVAQGGQVLEQVAMRVPGRPRASGTNRYSSMIACVAHMLSRVNFSHRNKHKQRQQAILQEAQQSGNHKMASPQKLITTSLPSDPTSTVAEASACSPRLEGLPGPTKPAPAATSGPGDSLRRKEPGCAQPSDISTATEQRHPRRVTAISCSALNLNERAPGWDVQLAHEDLPGEPLGLVSIRSNQVDANVLSATRKVEHASTPTDQDTPAAEIECTSCGDDLALAFVRICEHPTLSVALCTDCHERVIVSQECSVRDEDGFEEVCGLCGDGGELLCCDTPGCGRAFCEMCVSRVCCPDTSNEEDVARTLELIKQSPAWACFACDQAMLEPRQRALRQWQASSIAGDRALTVDSDEDEEAEGVVRGDVSEAEQERLVNQLVALEAELDEALENLEEERLEALASEVAQELAPQREAGEDVAELVRVEVAAYTEHWQGRLAALQQQQAPLQEMVQASGVDLFGVYIELEKLQRDTVKTEAWRQAPRLGQAGLSAEAAEAVRRADLQLAADTPLSYVNGELRPKNRGASGFQSDVHTEARRRDTGSTLMPIAEAGSTLMPDRGSTPLQRLGARDTGSTLIPIAELDARDTGRKAGDDVVTDQERKLYDAETPADAAGLDVDGVDEVVQLADLGPEELAKLDEEEREQLEEAIQFEAERCLTKQQVRRMVQIDEARDMTEMVRQTRLERRRAGLKRSGARSVVRSHAPRGKRRKGLGGASAQHVSGADGEEVVHEDQEEEDDDDVMVLDDSDEADEEDATATGVTGKDGDKEEEKADSVMQVVDLSEESGEGKPKGKKTMLDFFRPGAGKKRPKPAEEAGHNSDDEGAGGSAGGKTRAAKVMDDKKLSASTKEALELERERQKRLKQGKGAQTQVSEEAEGRVQINGRIEGEEPVWVCKALSDRLKPHQVEGIQFAWDNLAQSLELLRTGNPGLGAVLAHSMGLGKTLQVVALLHTLLKSPLLRECRMGGERSLNTALVLAPVNVVANWESEFAKWLPSSVQSGRKLCVYALEATGKQPKHHNTKLRQWQKTGGVLLCGYELYRSLCKGASGGCAAEWKSAMLAALQNPGPDVVVADEAHVIKNFKSDISKVLKQVHTKRRLALTGSPLQNNLLEYHCMVDFVRESFLGTRAEFCNQFSNPITHGQSADAEEADVRLMKRRSHVLHKRLQGFVQRRDASILASFLPPKASLTARSASDPARPFRLSPSPRSAAFIVPRALSAGLSLPGSLCRALCAGLSLPGSLCWALYAGLSLPGSLCGLSVPGSLCRALCAGLSLPGSLCRALS
ncbi:hypothetical protein CYMTET_20171 [Cymbomonas tetramitiformis]|uniref:Transcriptional regulator ATRX n=1 Tax=Cymbomonas tetramitiformis TaxID=36881 RepID=A0AAE0G4N2_9CHLO|nr:hypothetical protein CYMTET_20171 [Cymbomonas tetramitiformis]